MFLINSEFVPTMFSHFCSGRTSIYFRRELNKPILSTWQQMCNLEGEELKGSETIDTVESVNERRAAQTNVLPGVSWKRMNEVGVNPVPPSAQVVSSPAKCRLCAGSTEERGSPGLRRRCG